MTNRLQQKIYKHAHLLWQTSRQEAQHYGGAWSRARLTLKLTTNLSTHLPVQYPARINKNYWIQAHNIHVQWRNNSEALISLICTVCVNTPHKHGNEFGSMWRKYHSSFFWDVEMDNLIFKMLVIQKSLQIFSVNNHKSTIIMDLKQSPGEHRYCSSKKLLKAIISISPYNPLTKKKKSLLK